MIITTRVWEEGHPVSADCSGRLAADGDLLWITSEMSYVVIHPFERSYLVLNSGISGYNLVVKIQKTLKKYLKDWVLYNEIESSTYEDSKQSSAYQPKTLRR